MAAHRAVTFVVQKENVEVSIHRASDHRAIHVRVTAWFPHQPRADMVIMFAKVTTLFEDRAAFDGRQTRSEHPQGFTARMHVDGGNSVPMRRRPPLRKVKE